MRRPARPLPLLLAPLSLLSVTAGCDQSGEARPPVVVMANGPVVHDGAQAKPIDGSGELSTESKAPASEAWTLVQEMEGPTRLEDFERGVLASAAGRSYAEIDGRLVAMDRPRPEAGPDDGWSEVGPVVEGRFPDDAWLVTVGHYDRSGAAITLRQLETAPEGATVASQWVERKIKPPEVGYFEADGKSLLAGDAFMLRKGTLGGYLVAGWEGDAIGFSRAGARRGAPRKMDLPDSNTKDPGMPVDLVEDGSGRIHVFSFRYEDDKALMLSSRRCARDAERCEPSVNELGELPQGNLAAVAHRGPKAFSASVNDGWTEATWSSHLLHYDKGRWSTEAVPGPGHLRALVSTEKGSLWAVLQTGERGAEGDAERCALWRRDTDGTWHAVTLPSQLAPQGADGLDIAVDDTDRLWLAVNGAGRHAVFVASPDALAAT